MTLRRVVVTGGAGFVGSHLCERLVAGGISVTVLDDLSRGRRAWLPAAAHLVELDVRDRAGVGAAIAEAAPDAVVHLAALHYIPAVDEAPALAREINVEGTRNVADAVREASVPRVLFASTAAVYPDSAEPLRETVTPAPIDLYGETKAAGEELLAGSGAACVFARLFNVVGPRETNPHVLPEIVAQVASGAGEVSLGATSTVRDFVDVRDVGDALVELLHLPPNGHSAAYNVATGRGTSIAEIVELCSRAAGRRVRIAHDPARIRGVDRPSLVADIGAIERATGWRPAHSLQSTLAELLGAR